jgi:ABC-type dipeptide/oligopeptide/nickel transport system ATPase component
MTGCTFAPRCAFAFERCPAETPAAYLIGPGHASACFLAEPK